MGKREPTVELQDARDELSASEQDASSALRQIEATIRDRRIARRRPSAISRI